MSTLSSRQFVFPAAACLGILGLAVVTACGPGSLGHQDDREIDCELPLPADIRVLRVTVPLGSVTVTAGAAGVVAVDAILRHLADTREGLDRLLAAATDPAVVTTDDAGVYDLRLAVEPAGLDPNSLSHAVILRGSLALPKDVEVRLETRRGHLAAVDRDARVELHTASGDCQLTRVRGDARVFTGLGECTIVDHRGGLDVESKKGTILAFLREIGASGVSLQTHSPSIVVHLPADAGFALDARVERCQKPTDLRTSFGVPVEKAGSGMRAVGPVRGGGPDVTLRVGRGHLSIPHLPDRR